MRFRFLSLMALKLVAGAIIVSAQPGPITTSNNSNLFFAASTLLTNGLPGLSGPPVTLMVATVQSDSAQGGTVSLVGSQEWARRYNGPANNDDQAYDVIVDHEGNIIAAGYATGIGSGADFLTIKYSPNGEGLWTNRYNGPGNGSDQISAVAVDGSNGVYVTGDSEGITTLKYAADGTAVWTNTYSSAAMFMFFTGLAVDHDGNAYIATVDADSDSFVTIKYDASGNPAWTNFFKSAPTSQENASDIAVDAAGNIFVTGSSFDSGSGGGCLTIKCASDGTVLWANRYTIEGVGGTGGSGTRVIVDQQENDLVAVDMHSIYGNRYAVVKYSNAGAALWTNVINAVSYGGGGVPQITVDPVGNVFLVGGTFGGGGAAADFTTVKYSSSGLPLWTNRFIDLNAGNYSFFGAATDTAGNLFWSIASGAGGNNNYVTVKYAATGGAVWTNRYNGPANGSDNPRAMTVDQAGGIYVTGVSPSGPLFSASDWGTVKYADNVRYAPPSGFVGQDTVTFTAFDSFGNSALGTVTIDVLHGDVVLPATVVAPDDYTTGAGNTGLNTLVRSTNLARTYQMQFTPEALGGLPAGARITELRFRVSTNTAVSFPATPVTWADYEVTLARALNPITSMSTVFQANLLNPVLVKDGALAIGVDNFSAGDNPNLFGPMVVLDTPYVYQGGDLLLHFTHSGSDSASNPFLDAASTAAPGYGTSFRAISANAFAATSGTAAAVTIVEIVSTPIITQGIAYTGNELIISGAGGFTGATYRILTSTNLELPVVQWTPIVTNQFGAGGGFSHTNLIQPNQPAQYFRVSMP